MYGEHNDLTDKHKNGSLFCDILSSTVENCFTMLQDITENS